MRFFLILLLSFVISSHAKATVFNPQSFTLKNGMQVVLIPNNRVPVVKHMVWYKVGSADEPAGKSGIAHYFEHLMFKGTDKIAPGEFSKIYILAAMAFIAAIGLLIWMIKEGRLRFAIPCGAIVGGALGNGIDRLHWGAVADFLDFHAMGYHWPAFNVADIGITCGATLLIVDSLFTKSDSSKTNDSE